MLTIYERGQPGYEDTLVSLSRRGDEDLARVEPDVRAILDAVRERGDDAILEYAERFDGRRPTSLVLSRDAWLKEARVVDPAVREALAAAADRIRRYHEHQRESGFRYEEDGVELGQRVQPVAAAAVYAPGGKARYPSTVLMTAVPARVAGVPMPFSSRAAARWWARGSRSRAFGCTSPSRAKASWTARPSATRRRMSTAGL